MYRYVLMFLVLAFVSCGSETIPKPKAYLSLNYPENKYKVFESERPYLFEISSESNVQELPENWLKIKYPKLKASVDITYRPVSDNLKELLMEAEKLVFEHTIKADNISNTENFIDEQKRVFGKMFFIHGNAASQVQFHVTDSVKHFLKASLFFYTKPNYDSVLPAVDYIKKDMIHMMETLQWKE
ncbi:gliding motility lipoprotein GldD [Tenacibaculum sp. SZ-18]|uniref:gliding motility lipoprotein GldD n=1 Tax=Tenacibaculum sp. SZ-18 TaxID=754423 RepID=UPI000C2D604C|nr:gliding motility lipoprotein GldD [Tenacibaculum sp. SZ-18]AUC16495.1 gliding motility lipoprotein GldD [Tenacibaculum sp. SZ-18]